MASCYRGRRQGWQVRVAGRRRGDGGDPECCRRHLGPAIPAEVWLADCGKWAFADGQFGYVPVLSGGPLN
ncbi:MAG: hypothetical protein ACYC6I_05065, partial [Bacillota bacterium]